jgi:hypothetical protein
MPTGVVLDIGFAESSQNIPLKIKAIQLIYVRSVRVSYKFVVVCEREIIQAYKTSLVPSECLVLILTQTWHHTGTAYSRGAQCFGA